MAFEILTDLPVLAGGHSASKEPRMSVADNGQVTFNSASETLLKDYKYVGAANDPAKPGTIGLIAMNDKKGADMLKANPNAAVFALRSNKTTAMYFNAARLFKKVGYDYKAAGRQAFDLETIRGPKDVFQGFLWTVPKETPAKRPTIKRVSKPKVNGADTSGTPMVPPPASAVDVDDVANGLLV